MSKRLDLVGKRFGNLVVLEMLYNEKKKSYTRCLCLCDCGNTVVKDTYRLTHAKITPSCGCNYAKQMSEKLSKDIIGKRFGRLVVLETIWEDGKPPMVKCICDCGNIVILRRNDVMTGHTKSCGCLHSEATSKARERDHTGYISDFGVELLRPYKRNDSGQMLWECRCGFCGKIFYAIPAFVKNNHVRSCGCLVSSSMEKFIGDFLDDIGITYETQYVFDECVNGNGNKLRFDFAIIEDDAVSCLIEYDGEQHYRPVDYFGGKEGFKKRQRYDAIKNEYCKENNIQLLRLPYYLNNEEIKNEITNTLNP